MTIEEQIDNIIDRYRRSNNVYDFGAMNTEINAYLRTVDPAIRLTSPIKQIREWDDK